MRFSIYQRARLNTKRERQGAVVSLDATANRILTGEKGLAYNIMLLRKMLAKNEIKRYKKQKALILPAATFSGIFSIRDTNIALSDKFSQHSGLLTFDVDGIDPNAIDAIKTVLSLHPNILLVFTSPSNTGVKAILRVDPIPTTQNDLEHKHVWALYKAQLDETLSIYGYQCDSGGDPTRLCFLAHDPNAYYNPTKPAGKWDRDAYHIETKRQEQEQRQAQTQGKTDRAALESRNWDNSEIDPHALDHIHPDSVDYDGWLCIMTACKKMGIAWQDVEAWSRQGTKHIEGDIEKRWTKLDTSKASWGTVIHFAKLNGYQPPQRQRTPKLQSANSHRHSQKHESLERNRVEREQVADSFLDTTPDDKLHILLVKDSTGSGKSHTMLTKASQYMKRTLMNPPHNDLAEQAVDIAWDHGYKNPFHLLGREHNWNDSGIAEIPVAERNAELFDRNNCIMVDQIKAYTDKRLAPRTYCEHKCSFREGCLHLSQYKALAQHDFVASCTPNLLFDLNMRGYLQFIVTATDDPSEEELDINAILGTESETIAEFDFAIIDDYNISTLYTDITFSESEFKSLKKAWNGTPTSEFASLILKAFEKKKPQKIVKALRKAFESTAEHHTDIAKSLTQHARLGTIEYAERPKSSKESLRLLTEKIVRYTDSGIQFIPVDFEAYQELESKGIPSIPPQHLQTTSVGEQVWVPHTPVKALASGVELKDLTPVWQSGATPIDLIRIFLESIGTDKNAPIRRSFRVGDPPIAILTFSIPPQAPVGIIPQIAMLSATTDPTDTQHAFDKQTVSFSEHSGGQLEWADGVEVYQFQDARLTSGSIFEYPTDDDGKRILQSEPTGFTSTAEQRIAKLNEWAEQTDGLTAFISYKEFTDNFTASVNNFDIITHFDKVAGLNFDGLKLLVIFGYPKVKHEVVIDHARTQYGSDSKTLPKGTYDELTATNEWQEHGVTITERRYLDSRLEKIRHQLSTEKLEQAIGRARLPRWASTTTVIFTNAPTNPTSRATLFTGAAFNLASAPSQLPTATQQIIDAEASGDVQAVMGTQGVSKRTAERKTQDTRAEKKAERDAEICHRFRLGQSKKQIATEMNIGRATVKRVLDTQA